MATHRTSQGCLFKVRISPTLTTIPLVISVNAPGIVRKFEDGTHLGSTGNFTEYMATLNDTDIVTADMFFDPLDTVHEYLIAQANLAVALTDLWELSYPQVSGAKKWSFSGIIQSFKPTAQGSSLMKAPLEVRVTGAPTWAA